MKSLFKYICCIAAFLPLAACVGSEEPAGPLRTRVEGIGQAVGLSRVTVSRVLGELSADGLVELGYRRVTLSDKEALKDLIYEL